jgi:glucose uptake protein GlcU
MGRDPQQPLAQVVGAVLTLVGVAGFVTGGTLLIFGINALHNVVHLVSGVLGLAAGFYAGGQWARYYNQGFGVIYLLVTALGFVAPALTASLLAINSADNFLHLALGIVLAGVGFGVLSRAMA